jgi:hypothetical protein
MLSDNSCQWPSQLPQPSAAGQRALPAARRLVEVAGFTLRTATESA